MGTDLKMQEVEILRILHKERYINQRKLADISGYSVGYVNKSLKSLLGLGLLEPDMSLSESAHKLFVQRRPANAIILAAGFGMRMVEWYRLTGQRQRHCLNSMGRDLLSVSLGSCMMQEYMTSLLLLDL